jgi:hypothetical protein
VIGNAVSGRTPGNGSMDPARKTGDPEALRFLMPSTPFPESVRKHLEGQAVPPEHDDRLQ